MIRRAHRREDRTPYVRIDNPTVEALVRAWREPGPSPIYHETMKRNLARDWRPLFVAVMDLVKLIEELDEATSPPDSVIEGQLTIEDELDGN